MFISKASISIALMLLLTLKLSCFTILKNGCLCNENKFQCKMKCIQHPVDPAVCLSFNLPLVTSAYLQHCNFFPHSLESSFPGFKRYNKITCHILKFLFICFQLFSIRLLFPYKNTLVFIYTFSIFQGRGQQQINRSKPFTA